MINLVNIYIKRKVIGEKIPTRVPAKSSAVGSVSHRRTWGTRSRKNLMKACLGYRSVRNVRWAVEKMPAQKGMMCDKVRDHCGDVEILLSSRGAKEENFEGLL